MTKRNSVFNDYVIAKVHPTGQKIVTVRNLKAEWWTVVEAKNHEDAIKKLFSDTEKVKIWGESSWVYKHKEEYFIVIGSIKYLRRKISKSTPFINPEEIEK